MADHIRVEANPAAHQPLLARAAELENALERLAAAHGYPSYTAMRQRLAHEGARLNARSRDRLLRDLRRLAPDVERVQQALPATDATGLVAIHDLVKSVARLIRVLLVGYTEEEMHELADRAKAGRAFRAQTVGNKVEEEHSDVINTVKTLAKLPSRKGAP